MLKQIYTHDLSLHYVLLDFTFISQQEEITFTPQTRGNHVHISNKRKSYTHVIVSPLRRIIIAYLSFLNLGSTFLAPQENGTLRPPQPELNCSAYRENSPHWPSQPRHNYYASRENGSHWTSRPRLPLYCLLGE